MRDWNLIVIGLACGAWWLAGCSEQAAPPDRLAAERAAHPDVVRVLDGTATADRPLPAELPQLEAAGHLTADALAGWLMWRAANRPAEAAHHGLLGVDLTTGLGSDWRLRRELDVPIEGDPAADNRDAIYAGVAADFRAIVSRQLAADLEPATTPVPADHLTLAHLQAAAVRGLAAHDAPRALLLELLGEVLAAQQQRTLAYRAWRLAVREYVALAEAAHESAAPDARWTAAFAAGRDGDLAALNQLLSQQPEAPGAAWLKRAGWCAWFMRQVRGDVGTADDVWFSEYRIRRERGEPVGELVDEPPVALRPRPWSAPMVAGAAGVGVVVLLALVWVLRRRRAPGKPAG